MAHDVFVSYSSHDKLTADAVCATLEGHGIRCWIAPRDIMPGNDWSDAIIDAITECRIFLLVLSGASNLSEQVKREVQNAVGEAKPILPLRIEEVDLSKHMRYFIGTPHWMDALTAPMEMHLHRMAQTVAALIGSLEDKGVDQPLKGVPEAKHLAYQAAPPALDVTQFPARPHANDSQMVRTEIPEATVTACAGVLAEFIGPLAKVLSKRTAKDAVDLADFRRRLSDQLSSESEKSQFLKKIEGIGKP